MRRLIFPLTELRDDASLEQQTDGVVPEYQILPWPTNDQFEPVVFIGQLSLRQFIQLTSAIDVGRDIAYPDESSQIWLDWVRFIEGFVTVDCADVLTCILNDPAIMEAIIEKLIGAGFSKNGSVPPAENIGDERFPPSERQSDIKELQNCNLDALWGGIRSGIVKYLDDTARTLLEDLIVQQDKAERAALFIESLPIFGEIASTAILNVTEAAEDLLNLYNGYSSESALDQIACDLFQLCCSQCRYPTFQEVFDYYRNLGIQNFADFSQVTANLLIDYLIGSSQAAQQAAYFTIIAAGVLVPLYFETKVKDFIGGKKQLEIWANVGEDFASDNWNVLCGGCNAPSCETNSVVNFENQSPDGLIIRDTTATEYALFSTGPLPRQAQWGDYDSVQRLGDNVLVNYQGVNRVICTKTIQLPASRRVCQIEITVRMWGNNNPAQLVIWTSKNNERTWYETRSTNSQAEQTFTFDVNVDADAIHIRQSKLYSGSKVGIREIKIFWDAS